MCRTHLRPGTKSRDYTHLDLEAPFREAGPGEEWPDSAYFAAQFSDPAELPVSGSIRGYGNWRPITWHITDA